MHLGNEYYQLCEQNPDLPPFIRELLVNDIHASMLCNVTKRSFSLSLSVRICSTWNDYPLTLGGAIRFTNCFPGVIFMYGEGLTCANIIRLFTGCSYSAVEWTTRVFPSIEEVGLLTKTDIPELKISDLPSTHDVSIPKEKNLVVDRHKCSTG